MTHLSALSAGSQQGLELGSAALRYPDEERSLLRLLRDQAVEHGDKPWLIFDNERSLSFLEAESLTNRVSRGLEKLVGRGAHAGLMLRNQFEFLPVELGAMSNGVAVPLNAELRGQPLGSVVTRSDIRVLFIATDLTERLAALDDLGSLETIIVVGEDAVSSEILGVPVVNWDDWIAQNTDDRPVDIPAWDTIGVISFTSGTTGRAKGAMSTHHHWFLYSATITDSMERTRDDVLTTPLPIFHGGALHLIVNSALHAGCTAHLQSKFSASRFWQQAAQDGATHAFLLGPMAAMIDRVTEEAPEHSVVDIYCLPAPPKRTHFEKKFAVTLLSQGWGMTEFLGMPMRRVQLDDQPDNSIGYPVAWADCAVVDEHDRVLPPGEVGELVWRSHVPLAMFSGYYKEPELTLETFRNLWFHTGDAASREENGIFYFHGRLKDRVRRRGELIDTAEVEHVACQHPRILEAVAFGVPSDLGEDDVKLDIIVSGEVDLAEYHAWLCDNLPRFAVPRFLEIRTDFPKTATQRIEKYRLAAEPVSRPSVFDADASRQLQEHSVSL